GSGLASGFLDVFMPKSRAHRPPAFGGFGSGPFVAMMPLGPRRGRRPSPGGAFSPAGMAGPARGARSAGRPRRCQAEGRPRERLTNPVAAVNAEAARVAGAESSKPRAGAPPGLRRLSPGHTERLDTP